MERPAQDQGERPRRPVDYINNRAVCLDDLEVDELQVLHEGCIARFKRARFELAVVQDALEERLDPDDDKGLTL